MDELRLALFLALIFPVLGGARLLRRLRGELRLARLRPQRLRRLCRGLRRGAAGLALLGVLRAGHVDRRHRRQDLAAGGSGEHRRDARAQPARPTRRGAEEEERRDTYGGELFLATVGALFLAFNVAPTEEIVLIATMMTGWQALALVGVSLAIMHAFVYAVEFRGQAARHPEIGVWSEFLRVTVVAYALALLVCLYVLWSFGRSDGLAFGELLMQTVVLGFPAAVGAAAARLIL